MAKKDQKKTKKKVIREVSRAKVYVTASFNNTLVTFADMEGNVICWGSSGTSGFKGTRKSTPYAATVTTDSASQKAKDLGVKEIEVYVKGPGPGRESVLRALKAAGFKFNLIADVTAMPHNGPRPKKARRV